jgi:glycosyltransferase involved in cell wall biosynthesis
MNSRVITVLAGAPVGGAEIFFTSLSAALAHSGINVRSVLKPNPLRESGLRQAGIDFVTAPFRTPFDWTTKRMIRKAAEEFRPDVILAFAGRATRFVPKGPYKVVGRLGGYYNLANFSVCDHLVCNSPDVMRHVLAGGWPEAKASLIPNFAGVPATPPAKRSDFDTPESAPLALALGRLHPNKGLDILIRAAARIPDLFVWIAGEGSERSNLELLTHELQLGGRIKFLGWRSDRGALYAAADICVYPSREEPFGNVVVEAWSCGVPLISTRTAGPSWLARDREDALLAPVDDEAALALAIRELLGSPALRQALVAAGKRRISGEFSEPAVVNRYADLFRALTE